MMVVGEVSYLHSQIFKSKDLEILRAKLLLLQQRLRPAPQHHVMRSNVTWIDGIDGVLHPYISDTYNDLVMHECRKCPPYLHAIQ